MKRTLLFIILCCTILFSFAQSNNDFFAITGQSASQFNWSDIRRLPGDIATTGQFVYENGKTAFTFYDADSRKEIKQFPVSVHHQKSKTSLNITSPTGLMSAAVAFDKRHNKLFFASMNSGHLIWLDLNRPNDHLQFYVVPATLVANNDFSSEALNITRMAIGADGDGYALTNDGNHLIRFTTGRKIASVDLGNLIDDPSNGSISIHNQCDGWGGDIVAHASGNLVLFTAAKGVYEIDPHSRIAKFTGMVKDLPAAFSVNGAAVDKDGFVVISSANVFDGFYRVDMSSLAATKIVTSGIPVNASDLASGFLLGRWTDKAGVAVLPPMADNGNELISIFPNPVKNRNVRIMFENNLPGNYQVIITDLQGRLIQSKSADILCKGQVQQIKLDKTHPADIYFVKVLDVQNRQLFNSKILIE